MATQTGTDAGETLVGTEFSDSLDGAGGDDSLVGEAGEDTLTGGNGGDYLSGGEENDSLDGGLGADDLYGDAGNDTLSGVGGEADSMSGGAGDDVYIVDAYDSIFESEGEGVDEVRTSGSYTDLQEHFENLTGLGFDLRLHGNDAANSIRGGTGADTLNGLGGDDTLNGGAGDDLYEIYDFSGGPGLTPLDAEAGLEVVVEAVDGGVDSIVTNLGYAVMADNVERIAADSGGSRERGVEGLEASVAYHHFIGNDLANTMTGGTLADTLDGGAGDDSLIGGLGSDVYVIDAEGDQVFEDYDAGIDRVITSLSYYQLGDDVEDLSSAIVEEPEPAAFLRAAGQHLVGNFLSNVIFGGSGADTLEGAGGEMKLGRLVDAGDTLAGGGGGDTYEIRHQGVLVHEGGEDLGVDVIRTSLRTFQNFDNVERLVFEGRGSFTAVGAATGESIIGGGASDVLQGEDGEDYLAGMNGRDRLDGGAGDDSLRGGLGGDTLDGGDGLDALHGGAGNDVFLFADQDDGGGAPGAQNAPAGIHRDLILDLQSGDRIDLSAIDADTAADGDQDFVRVAAFSGQAGEIRLTYLAGRDVTVIRFDTDGDALADRVIVADGDHQGFDDFVL